MKEEKVELTEEELDQWADEYWSKRLYWTWLNWTEFMPWMMWDSSGISTNHPYGGYISSSTNTPNGTPGQQTQVICGNNPAASRMDFQLRDLRFCFWRGICEKNKNGKILFKDSTGNCLRKRWR